MFRAVDIGDGGDGTWAAPVRSRWDELHSWLTDEGRTPEGAAAARALFERHMPELVPTLDRLAAQIDRPGADVLLTSAALRPFFSSCTQIGAPGELLRNYDFSPDEVDGTIVRSNVLRPVLGMQEGAWGLLDGMNDAGLAVSLTFGGRFVHGAGFAVILVLRYLLETCDTVEQAVAKLRSIPIDIPQNVTIVDHERAVTVFVGPDMPLVQARDACAANHQDRPVPAEQEAFTRTQQRLRAIRASGLDLASMLTPPLYQTAFDAGLGTVYTAHYRPGSGSVTYYWPNAQWTQSFADFVSGERTVTLGSPMSTNA